MNCLIIYDSVYGNTEQIAQAIGNTLGSQMDVKVVRVSNVKTEQLIGLNLLVIGSPTHGGSPIQAIKDFLNQIPESSVREINVAAFDTRLATRWVKIFGYAAGKIADSLKKQGGTLVALPEAFFVKGRKGPLKEGELGRVTSWVNNILKDITIEE